MFSICATYDSVKERVYLLLSEMLKNNTDFFGQLPDVLEDVWIMVANKEQEEAEKIIDNVPKTHPFESRYNNGVKTIGWESCQTVLDKKEMRRYFQCGWNE